MGLPLGRDLVVGLVAPRGPARARVAREHLQVGPGRAGFDEVVLLIGLAGVLALAGLDHVDRRARRRQCAHRSLDAEQDRLGDVAEVEAHTAAVGPTVLAALGPNDVGDVAEAPRLEDLYPFEEQRVWHPEI